MLSPKKSLTLFIAGVWMVNGLYCKVMNGVPRHTQIVSAILGEEHSILLTKAIGIAETGMALWVLSRFNSRINAVVQIVIVLFMNLLELALVPELLLWGKYNIIFASVFVFVVYYHEFVLNRPDTGH